MVKITDIKPGDIFIIKDEDKFEAEQYTKKKKTGSVSRSFFLEEHYVALPGDYKNQISAIMFYQSRLKDGVETSTLEKGTIRGTSIPISVYESSPPSSIEILKNKEFRMVAGVDGVKCNLVTKRTKS